MKLLLLFALLCTMTVLWHRAGPHRAASGEKPRLS